ncbi:GNAT family N-acetyltransferase [Xylanibacillus composti]|nr:GNAT family N-acetyltransferase [Xylanibacillus composti]MDT9724292.1 GNAT family N-acetyltransferase [Xylanibacillus composti]
MLDVQVVRTEEQLAHCLSVRRKVFVEEQGVPEQLETDELDNLSSGARHVLAVHGDQPVGTGRWKRYAADAAKLQRIAVLPDWRGHGFGLAILHALEASALAEGCDRAILDAQVHARRFYEQAGYAAESEDIFDDAGIPHIRMEKRLIG